MAPPLDRQTKVCRPRPQAVATGPAGEVRTLPSWREWWEQYVARLQRRDPAAWAATGAVVLALGLMVYFSAARRPPALQRGPLPAVPEAVSRGSGREPRLRVYFHETGRVEEMDMEEYLKGVVAAEMEPAWPLAALEAQAIIARTFTLERIDADGGVPERNAHASTDHREFQAYNAQRVNEQVEQAVANTRGQVVVHDGRFARTWFHAYSGGQTTTPAEGLGVDAELDYLPSVVDRELDEDIPEEVKFWTMRVPGSRLRRAVERLSGKDPGTPRTVRVSRWTDSGRAATISVNGVDVGGNALRAELGGEQFKSTMLREITVEDGAVVFQGKGYGHGVGLSQWGAKVMADRGKSAEEIVARYYRGTYIGRLW